MEWQTDHPDNAVEEWIEGKIKQYTEYDIDLTPITGKEIQSLNPKEDSSN